LENKENGFISFVKNLWSVFEMPCSRNVLIAGFLRNFCGCIVNFYLPVFFGKNFPTFKAEYALVNAAINSICGLISSIVSGVVADKYESKTPWAKGLVCLIG
jgi:hypothetical protein